MTDLDDTHELLERVKHLIRLFETWTIALKEAGSSGHIDLAQLLVRLEGINKEMRTAAMSMAVIAGKDGTFGQIREEMAEMKDQMDRQEDLISRILVSMEHIQQQLNLPLPGREEN